jgi:hypothetical protein
MSERESVRLSLAQLTELVEAALRAVGVSPENVAAIAGTIVASERDGTRSHGLLRLPGFLHSIQIGWADGQARPTVVSETPSLLVVDAQNGFAQAALAFARPRLASMVRSSGAAILLTRNSHHYAALWPDIEEFAVEGFIALTCVNSKKRMGRPSSDHRHECHGLRMPTGRTSAAGLGPIIERALARRCPFGGNEGRERRGRCWPGCCGRADDLACRHLGRRCATPLRWHQGRFDCRHDRDSCGGPDWRTFRL